MPVGESGEHAAISAQVLTASAVSARRVKCISILQRHICIDAIVKYECSELATRAGKLGRGKPKFGREVRSGLSLLDGLRPCLVLIGGRSWTATPTVSGAVRICHSTPGRPGSSTTTRREAVQIPPSCEPRESLLTALTASSAPPSSASSSPWMSEANQYLSPTKGARLPRLSSTEYRH